MNIIWIVLAAVYLGLAFLSPENMPIYICTAMVLLVGASIIKEIRDRG